MLADRDCRHTDASRLGLSSHRKRNSCAFLETGDISCSFPLVNAYRFISVHSDHSYQSIVHRIHVLPHIAHGVVLETYADFGTKLHQLYHDIVFSSTDLQYIDVCSYLTQAAISQLSHTSLFMVPQAFPPLTNSLHGNSYSHFTTNLSPT